MMADYKALDRTSRGKIKRMDAFWNKANSAFWQRFNWLEVRDLCRKKNKEDVIEEVHLVS